MQFFVDTHAHLYADQFDLDREECLKKAIQENIKYIFLPNIDLESIEPMLQLEHSTSNCFAMMGLHPCSVQADYKIVLDEIRSWLDRRYFCAVGEIGLDYYWSRDFDKEQKDAFRIQCRWAKELNVPIVIHARDSIDDLIQIVSEEKTQNFRGVFHCFGGTLEQAKKIIDLGFKLGLGGVLTFKKANLGEVIQHIDLEHIVLETDAPYLAPVPFRGKRNECAYIPYVAQKLAEVKSCAIDEIARITSMNAIELFDPKELLIKRSEMFQ